MHSPDQMFFSPRPDMRFPACFPAPPVHPPPSAPPLLPLPSLPPRNLRTLRPPRPPGYMRFCSPRFPRYNSQYSPCIPPSFTSPSQISSRPRFEASTSNLQKPGKSKRPSFNEVRENRVKKFEETEEELRIVGGYDSSSDKVKQALMNKKKIEYLFKTHKALSTTNLLKIKGYGHGRSK